MAISCGQLASWGNLVRHSTGALVPAAAGPLHGRRLVGEDVVDAEGFDAALLRGGGGGGPVGPVILVQF